MPNPAAALQVLSPLIDQRTVVDGFVSTTHPAPTSFADQLFVVVPEYSTTQAFGPCDWGAIHGTTLPAQGAKVVIVFDEREVPVVVGWAGAFSAPTTWEPGDLKTSARSSAGSEWLGPCKGQAVSRTTYAALFAEIGTTYGEGDKATTFNLPSGEGRFLLGASGAHPLGAKGGEEAVKLTANQLAAHTHPLTGETYSDTVIGLTTGATSITVVTAPTAKVTGSTGGGEAHENMPPWTAVNLFIHV